MARFFVFILLFNFFFSYAQDSCKLQFPLGIPVKLSANYGDIRSAQFHTGIDFRTEMTEGFPVHAIDDGYVARIKIENAGYGKAIYINHPNGKTSVYAHLKCFNDSIDEYIKQQQYEQESFTLDLTLQPFEIAICKGKIVGFSGNTGFSSGPHMHFEIRDTKSQNILNVLKHFPLLSDSASPVYKSLHVYSLKSGYQKEGTRTKSYPIVNIGGKYVLKNKEYIPVWGETGFGIQANDFIADSDRTYQVYSIQMYVDTTLWFESAFDEFSFAESLNVNGYIDYEQKNVKKINVYEQFVLSNNTLSIYKSAINNGRISIADTALHTIKYVVADVQGNSSFFEFEIKNDSALAFEKKQKPQLYSQYLSCSHTNTFERKNVKVFFPENALYDDLAFIYSKSPAKKNLFSEIYHIHNKYTPLKRSISLSIKPKVLKHYLFDKYLIVSIDAKGKQSSVGGEYADGYVTSKVKLFGDYAIGVDTVAPVIKSIQVPDSMDYTCADTMFFKISDDLSGIGNYYGCIDNKWVLFEYHNAMQALYYVFDKKRFGFAEIHKLELWVDDKKNNYTYYNGYFYK
jgi:murein DD-endopeptidase MepM/ murein hydrolase activator NlpD